MLPRSSVGDGRVHTRKSIYSSLTPAKAPAGIWRSALRVARDATEVERTGIRFSGYRPRARKYESNTSATAFWTSSWRWVWDPLGHSIRWRGPMNSLPTPQWMQYSSWRKIVLVQRASAWATSVFDKRTDPGSNPGAACSIHWRAIFSLRS